MAVDMTLVKVDPLWTSKISAQIAIKRQIMPFLLMDGLLHVACTDVNNRLALRAVEQVVDMPLKAVAAEAESLKEVIKQVYGHILWANLQMRYNPRLTSLSQMTRVKCCLLAPRR